MSCLECICKIKTKKDDKIKKVNNRNTNFKKHYTGTLNYINVITLSTHLNKEQEKKRSTAVCQSLTI